MNLRTLAAALTLVVPLLSADAALAADPERGRALSQRCMVCHGQFGESTMPGAPNLFGQPEIYLAAQIAAFRDGVRNNEVMSIAAQGLGDEDIADLAAWYASIGYEVKPPQ